MKVSTIGPVSVCVGILALAACAAGSTTVKPAGNTAKSNVVYTAADAQTDAKIPYTYTLIKKNGVEFYCHTETSTGSHTRKNEICQTKEQIDAERSRANNTVEYAQGR